MEHIFNTNAKIPYETLEYYKTMKHCHPFTVQLKPGIVTKQNDRFPSFDRSCAECVWRKSGGGFTERWGDNSHCSRETSRTC